MKQPSTAFLLTAGVAKLCGVTPSTVRFWERTGRIPALRTENGVRLFSREDVERLALEKAPAPTEQPSGEPRPVAS
jgi:predicted site-specific integrase-resolvase